MKKKTVVESEMKKKKSNEKEEAPPPPSDHDDSDDDDSDDSVEVSDYDSISEDEVLLLYLHSLSPFTSLLMLNSFFCLLVRCRTLLQIASTMTTLLILTLILNLN